MARNPLHRDVQFIRDPRLPEVELRTCSYSTEAFRPHTHEGFSIALVEGGATRFDLDNLDYPAVEGDIVVIPPHVAHACNPDPHISYRLFYVETRWFAQAAPGESRNTERLELQRVVKDPALYMDLLRLHEQICERRTDDDTPAQLQDCLRRLLEKRRLHEPTAKACAQPSVESARQLLEQRWSESVPLAELAHAAGASRYQLIRRFKQETGLTPHAYQLQLRVEAAKRALANGDSITQVALKCGFADQSHFTRVFREHTGATPSQYQDA